MAEPQMTMKVTEIPQKKTTDIPWDVVVGTPKGYTSVTYPNREEYIRRGGGRRAVADVRKDFERRQLEEAESYRKAEEVKREKEKVINAEYQRQLNELRQDYLRNLNRRDITRQERVELMNKYNEERGAVNYETIMRKVEEGVQEGYEDIKTPAQAEIMRRLIRGEDVSEAEVKTLPNRIQEQVSWTTVAIPAGEVNKPSSQPSGYSVAIDLQRPPQPERTFTQRFVDTQKKYRTFSKIGGFSALGAMDFVATEVSNLVGKEKQPIAVENIPPYRLRGSISPNAPVFSLLSDAEKLEVQERKTEAAKQGAYIATQQLPYFALGAIGTPLATGVASGLLLTTSAEQYTTLEGRRQLVESSKTIGKPLAYSLPAAGIALGALGLRQSYYRGQLEALKNAKAELSIGQPIKTRSGMFVKQIAESRVPMPGFKYKPEFRSAITRGGEYISTPEPTLFGKYQYISPRAVTPTYFKLTHLKTGGYKFLGKTETEVYLNSVTGGVKTYSTSPYTIFGKVLPAESANVVKKFYNGIKVTKIANKPFAGEIRAEITPPKKEYFAGFPVKKTDEGIQIVVSGKIEKAKIVAGKITFITTPKTLGLILPEITPKTTLMLGKKGALIPQIQITKPSVTETYAPTRLTVLQTTEDILGKGTHAFGLNLINIPEVKAVPLYINPLKIEVKATEPKFISGSTQLSNQINVPKLMQVPKAIQVPKTIQSSKTLQVPKQVQTPMQIQVPKEIQIPKLTQVQKTIRIPKQPTPIKVLKFVFATPKTSGETTTKLKNLIGLFKQAYEVRVRRGGKFFPVSKTTLPFGKAAKLGAEKVSKSLAATFKLVPKGVTAMEDISYSPSKEQFRAPKSGEKLTWVELKPLRIKKGTGEIPEILKIRSSTYKLRGGKSKKRMKFL